MAHFNLNKLPLVAAADEEIQVEANKIKKVTFEALPIN
jgi:hypothetical protein